MDILSMKPLTKIAKEYYINGTLEYEIPYKNGEKEGTEKGYYKNGNLL